MKRCSTDGHNQHQGNILLRGLHTFTAVTLLLTALLLAACTAAAAGQPVSASVVEALSAADSDSYARAASQRQLSFPRDHGPHPAYRTEWWYYTGNLAAADGTDFGYQLTFFRIALTGDMPQRVSDLATNQVYMAHFAVSDGGKRKHTSFDRYSRGAGGLAGAQVEPRFQVWLEDWTATEIEPGVIRLQAQEVGAEGPLQIDLTLRETRPPVPHGENGLHQKGAEAGNASYYYSLIGLQTEGTVVVGDRTIAVQGQSWMDHEFGTSALSEDAVGWDWFSIQFDNGAALMLYQIRTRDGGTLPYVEGTYVTPDNRRVTLGESDFHIQATGQWISPRTGITYSSGWIIDAPELAMRVSVVPLFPDQEMDVNFVYWEGAAQVEGTLQGERVTGRGYVELTGYGEESGAYQR